MTSPYGAVQPVPQNAPSSAEYVVGVQPGISNAVVAANVVIVYGAGGGIFLYNGTPAAGNLIAAITSMAGTDAFGNAYTPVLEVGDFTGRHLVIDPNGDIYIYNSANVSVARWITSDGSMRIYNTGGAGAGNLIVALAPDAGSDSFGNTYSEGLTVTEGTISGTAITGGTITGTTITGGTITTVYTGGGQVELMGGNISITDGSGNLVVSINPGQNVFNYIDGNQGVSGGTWGLKEVWHDWNLVNGWGAGGGGPGARYTYIPTGTTAGAVMLSATLSPGTNTDGTLVGTIPGAYAPQSHTHTFPVATDHQSAVSNPYFQLDTSGNLTCYGIANAATVVGVEVAIPLAL